MVVIFILVILTGVAFIVHTIRMLKLKKINGVESMSPHRIKVIFIIGVCFVVVGIIGALIHTLLL